MSEEYNEEGFTTPFGKVLGTFQGVHGFSNGNNDYHSGQRNFVNGFDTGFKYHGIEYVRRWLLSKGLELVSVAFAGQIWRIRVLERISDHKPTSVRPFPNGSATPPVAESLLLWGPDESHVAVITEVSLEHKFIRIAEQNGQNNFWPGDYAREIPIEIKDGKYWIRDKWATLGWMVINFDVDGQDPGELSRLENPVQRHVTRSVGKIESKNEMEQKFDEVWGNIYESLESTSYYTVEDNFVSEVQLANVECGFLMTRLTKYVLDHPEIQSKFGLPAWSWEHISKGFYGYYASDGKVIGGRVEFAQNGRRLKVLRLYGDGLEGLAEVCYFQDVLAQRLGIEVGKSLQNNVYEQLVGQIKVSMFTKVHILASGQKNEGYLIPLLRKALSDAGLESKVFSETEYSKDEEGKFVDADGEVIRTVWKTETWASILSKAPNSIEEYPVIELLLSDQVKTLESIWRVVPSNPAIVPVMHIEMPERPLARAADWSISPLLENKEVEEVRYTFNNQEFSYFVEKFERQILDGHTPTIQAWSFARRITGFVCFEEGPERLPVYSTRIINAI